MALEKLKDQRLVRSAKAKGSLSRVLNFPCLPFGMAVDLAGIVGSMWC